MFANTELIVFYLFPVHTAYFNAILLKALIYYVNYFDDITC